MKKFFKSFFVIAVYSLIFSSVTFYYTVGNVIPNVLYKNIIEFKLAFSDDDSLVLQRLPFEDDVANVSTIYVEKSDILRDYRTELPYDYVPFFVIFFGVTHQINFAISDIKVNGRLVPIEYAAKALRDLGHYNVEVKGNELYAKYDANTVNQLDLYSLAKDKFVFMTRNEVRSNTEADANLRAMYYLALAIAYYLFFKFLIKNIIERKKFGFSIEVPFYGISFIILICLSNLIIYVNGILENIETLFYFLKNYLFIVIVPLLIYFFSLQAKFAARLIFFIVSLVFLLIVGVDHFVQSIFGTRLLFSTVGTFTGTLKDGIPFVIAYITSYCGFFYICAVAIFFILFWTKNEFVKLGKIRLIFVSLFAMGVAMMLVVNNKESNRFFNTFQVNVTGGWFSSGDYKRVYENYKKYVFDDLGYVSNKGLDQKKNVIVLLVESLSCEVTFLCGNKNDYMPNLKQFASDNVFFPHYFSNSVHTNGAIFTITTGFPLISGKDMKDVLLNDDFYFNDVVNKFHENGYLTSYYSPAEFVIDKDKQLVLSEYDVLSSSNDQYYDGFTKSGVFGSVSDENMFDKIIFDLKKIKNKPVFIMLTTVSTHTPYITPWGSNNIETAFNYTDYAITKFIKNLNDINYFDNGLVIITGDHRDWGFNDSDISKNVQSRISREKVPLIMIDGVNHNIVWDRVSFSHSSLAVMLEYMMLPTYERNIFQINPIVDTNDEFILYQNLNNMNEVIVKYGDREDTVVLDGDQTRFEGTLFNQYEQQQILGYISWLKR